MREGRANSTTQILGTTFQENEIHLSITITAFISGQHCLFNINSELRVVSATASLFCVIRAGKLWAPVFWRIVASKGGWNAEEFPKEFPFLNPVTEELQENMENTRNSKSFCTYSKKK